MVHVMWGTNMQGYIAQTSKQLYRWNINFHFTACPEALANTTSMFGVLDLHMKEEWDILGNDAYLLFARGLRFDQYQFTVCMFTARPESVAKFSTETTNRMKRA